MRYILDKQETENGKYTPDWEFDIRLDALKAKYSFKEFVFTQKNGELKKTYTIRISSPRQFMEFLDEVARGEATITCDPGAYVNPGWKRIIIQ